MIIVRCATELQESQDRNTREGATLGSQLGRVLLPVLVEKYFVCEVCWCETEPSGPEATQDITHGTERQSGMLQMWMSTLR